MSRDRSRSRVVVVFKMTNKLDKLEKGIQRTSQKETHRRAADDDAAAAFTEQKMVDDKVNLIKPIVDSLVNLSSEDESWTIRTKSFLRSCRLFLPVLDALGVAFKPAKSDVSGNVERLAKKEEEFENVSNTVWSLLLSCARVCFHFLLRFVIRGLVY